VTAPDAGASEVSYDGLDEPPAVAPPVDAVLLVSFGGPEGPGDVVPFLTNVTRGRGVPAERLAEVGRHYLDVFGGVSPLNAQARALRDALAAELRARGPALPVYWGNRNWHPYLSDALVRMRDDGVRHAVAVVMSAYPSYSGCRQYREDIWRARLDVVDAPLVTKLRHYYAEPGFLEPVARGVAAELTDLSGHARLLFCAHSIPVAMNATSGPDGGGYERTLRIASARVAGLVAARCGWQGEWDLVWQSRSGPPHVPWLEPDVGDRLETLYDDGVREVVLVPIGFVSDHVEVRYDLDVQARQRAAALPGMVVRRAATVGTDPQFVAMLRDLVVERLGGRELASHGAPATHDRCPARCCPPRVRR
jgi:ferrochelatase